MDKKKSFYVFDYGKYNGKKIEDIDLMELDAYLAWIETKKNNNDISGKLAIAFQKISAYLEENKDALNIEYEEHNAWQAEMNALCFDPDYYKS